MKKIFLLLALTLVSFFPLSAQSQDETLEFINTMFAAHSAPMATSKVMYKFYWEKEDFGRNLWIDMVVDNRLLVTFKCNPKDINSVTTYRAPNGNLCLKIVSTEGEILEKYSSKNSASYVYDFQLPLLTTDEEVLRLKRGIEHFLTLNGAKFPSDDFFRN